MKLPAMLFKSNSTRLLHTMTGFWWTALPHPQLGTKQILDHDIKLRLLFS